MGFHKSIRFVIRDGAGQYSRSIDDVFAAIGGSVITIPPGAPRANPLAKRWVRTVRHELLDRTLIWNQHQLRRLLEDSVAHYNEHRPHPTRTTNLATRTDGLPAPSGGQMDSTDPNGTKADWKKQPRTDEGLWGGGGGRI